jgi:hypothetical protein
MAAMDAGQCSFNRKDRESSGFYGGCEGVRQMRAGGVTGVILSRMRVCHQPAVGGGQAPTVTANGANIPDPPPLSRTGTPSRSSSAGARPVETERYFGFIPIVTALLSLANGSAPHRSVC